jgi:hypothetical protein
MLNVAASTRLSLYSTPFRGEIKPPPMAVVVYWDLTVQYENKRNRAIMKIVWEFVLVLGIVFVGLPINPFLEVCQKSIMYRVLEY